MRLVLNNGTYDGQAVIDAADILYTHLPQIVRGPDPATGMPGFYALGWTVDYEAPNSGRVFIGHAGAFSSGTRSFARLNVADGLGIVVLSNCFPTGAPDAVAFAFMDWVYYGNATRDWLDFWDGMYNELNAEISATDPGFDVSPSGNGNSSGPLPDPTAYAGVYSNEYVGRVSITTTNSTSNLNLNLTLEIGNRSLPLTYWANNVYVARVFAEAPESPSAVTFVLGPGGTATQVIVDVLNGDGGGVLDRES